MKPREKLINEGVDSLTEDELLAIILGSGNKNENVFELSKRIINSYGSLNNLLDLTYEELITYKGIKEAKATKIIASLELAKRIFKYKPKTFQFSNPELTFDFLKFDFFGKTLEYAIVLYLNKKMQLIKKQVVAIGSEDSLTIDSKAILKRALKLGANNLILAHNHPSNLLYPSEADISFTEALAKMAKNLDINLIDHLIIAGGSYVSMAKLGFQVFSF